MLYIDGEEPKEHERRMDEGQRQLEIRAEEAFASGDIGGWLCTYDNMRAFGLVYERIGALRERGLYEEALVWAYTSVRVNLRHFPEEDVRVMFAIADRGRLLAAADPLPGSGPWRVYRGVSGVGRARRINGLSWTTSLDAACWFAARYNLAGPAVFYRDVTPEGVYFCTNERSESEFVCVPSAERPKRWRIDADEIRERQGREIVRAEASRAREQSEAAANTANVSHPPLDPHETHQPLQEHHAEDLNRSRVASTPVTSTPTATLPESKKEGLK